MKGIGTKKQMREHKSKGQLDSQAVASIVWL